MAAITSATSVVVAFLYEILCSPGCRGESSRTYSKQMMAIASFCVRLKLGPRLLRGSAQSLHPGVPLQATRVGDSLLPFEGSPQGPL